MAQRMRPTIQGVQDRVVTLQSSLQQVKELLETGIGCIAYLRGLLPEESFTDCKLVARRPPDLLSDTQLQKEQGKKPPQDEYTSVRVKKLKRGSSPETNKLIDYLEVGAAEAIEKGYLHKLVFVIYLDPDEPTNIVESYTFTFTYETDAEGNKHPDMQVAEQLSGMDLSSMGSDPLPRNKPRKMSDIKRQVQQMIKNLITNTQVLDELPRRRYINVRLFYTDDTPPDYEPPYFSPVPFNAPGYSVTTPSMQDAPDFGTLGSVSTGYHGVALHTVSIAHILDVAYDENVSPDEALARNKRDAETRHVVWDAEALVQTVTDEDAKVVEATPVGVRDLSGRFLPMETIMEGEDEEMIKLKKRAGILPNPEAVFEPQGRMEETIVDSHMSDNEALRRAIAATEKRPPTNSLPATQIEPVVSRVKSFQTQVVEAHEEQARNEASAHASGSGLELAFKGKGKAVEPAQAVQPETQLFDYSQLSAKAALNPKETHLKETPLDSLAEPENIEDSASIAARKKGGTIKEPAGEKAAPTRRSTRARTSFTADACECGDKEDDGAMICCSTCEVWKHAICYGFEDARDSSIPDVFVCYHCRAKKGLAEASLQPEKEAEITHALAELRSLTLFRRAIDAVWHGGVMSTKDLGKYLAVDNATAGQVLKRLKAESFIIEQGASRKGKGKVGSKIGSLKAVPHVVNKTSKQIKRKKQEYFTPGQGAELAILSLFGGTTAEAEKEDVNDEPAFASTSAQCAAPAQGSRKEFAPETPREGSQPDTIIDEESRQASPAVSRASTALPARTAALGAARHPSADKEPLPSSYGAASNKRPFMAELDPNTAAGEDSSGQLPPRKRQKCSEATEVEV
ncbi:DNA-binding protein [Rhodotorula sp. JG-1b]|nr:DNA-binding protein [Rhodotorula sp. JG-1b]